MPDEVPVPPDRLDRSIDESHRHMDETKRLLDQARIDAGGESPATEEKGHQDRGSRGA